jgi:transposase
MLRTAFSDDCLSQAVVYQWVKQFKEGRESLKDDPRPGRPSTAHNEKKRLLKCVKKYALIAV